VRLGDAVQVLHVAGLLHGGDYEESFLVCRYSCDETSVDCYGGLGVSIHDRFIFGIENHARSLTTLDDKRTETTAVSDGE
jgi:hypothetical protein